MNLSVIVEVINETDNALLVTNTTRRNAEWIPVSLIAEKTKIGFGEYEISIPEWLAEQKGLV